MKKFPSSFVNQILKHACEYSYCVEQRDLSVDYPIKITCEESERLFKQAEQALHKFKNSSNQQLKKQYKIYVDSEITSYEQRITQLSEQLIEVKDVLSSLKLWEFDDKVGYQICDRIEVDYTEKQHVLEASIKNTPSGMATYYTFELWYQYELEKLKKRCDYYKWSLELRQNIVTKQNKWIDDLYNSLGLNYEQYVKERESN